MAQDIPQNTSQDKDRQVFFVDDDLIERLLRGDPAPVPARQQRPASSPTLAPAIQLASLGKLEQAIRELEGALERGENAVEVHTSLGHLRFEQQTWSEAERHYAKVAEQEPKHPAAHYNLGLCRERQSKFEEAISAFEAALAIEPKRWQAQIGRGFCLLRLNRPQPALNCWEAALHDLPAAKKPLRQDDILFGKAVALHQLGRLAEAADLYRQLLSRNPNSADLLANQIILSLACKEYNGIKELAERLHKLRPDSRAVLEGLAAVAVAQGDYGAAAQHCSQLVKAVPDSYEAWFNLGAAYQKTGRLEQSAAAFGEALRLRPQAAEANANLGAVRQERSDLAGARECYRRALEVSPELPGALWNSAIAAQQAGDAAEAEKLLERLVAVEPGWQDADFRLGYLQFQRGEYAGAVDCFEACVKRRPDWEDALVNLGLASWKFEDLETGSATFRQILTLNPRHAIALRCLTALAIEQKNDNEARECLAKLASLGVCAPELSYNLGLLLQSAGDYRAAAECYQAALRHKPGFSDALINLGHALQAAGKEDEARHAWSQAVAADPELASKYFQ